MQRAALAVGAILAAVSLTGGAAAETKAVRPNIVIIVGDDMGYADVGVHGCRDIPTPHIDSLAKGGVRCTSGYVSGPYCSPTRAGLLTGRYQQRFGHEFNPGPNPTGDIGLPLDQVTLADRLKQAGYATGMVGKWHLGNERKFHPLSRGFQEFYGFLGGAHSYFVNNNRGTKGQVNAVLRGFEPVDEEEYLTDAFAREAVAYIDRHQKEPFFLYLTFNAVHTPMHATDKYLARFKNVADEKRRTYCAMMSAMDDAIGQVLAKLDEAKLTENTLVAFISDNGGPQPANASSNVPLRGNKATTWEGGIRVPYLVQWKGKLPAGKTYDQPVIQLDLHATALAAAGATSEAQLDGVNLLPHLSGEKSSPPHDALYWRFGPQMAIRAGKYKLVKAAGIDQPQLFDLAADIGETKDLSAEKPDVVKSLAERYETWNGTLEEPRWIASQRLAGKKGPNAGKGKNKAKNKTKAEGTR
jgi:arylsulfatase A-like enzyme